MVRKNPEDLDPDLWLEEGELPELPENPRVVVNEEKVVIPVAEELELEIPVLPAEPLEEPMLPAEPVEESVMEGVHERVQVELYHEAKEAEAMIEEQLEVWLQWNAVPNLMMDPGIEEDRLEHHTKRRRDEVARGRRKQRKEDDIRSDKQEHSPSMQVQTQRPDGFYSDDWGEDQQEADD